MANPIIQRELVGTLRMGKAFGLQVVLIFVLTVLVLLKWPGDALVDMSGEQSRQMLGVFVYGLMATIMLLAPAFPATSIVREIEQRTLPLLLNSPMSRWSILLGKTAGVLGYVLLLLLLSLPAAAACYAMGGIDLGGQLLKIYLILFLLAIQYAAMGLWVSSYAATTDSALRITYGLVLLLSIVSLGPYFFALESTFEGLRNATNWIRCVSPIPAVMKAMNLSAVGSVVRDETDVVGRFMILSPALTVIFTLWTFWRLNQRIFDRARPAGKITDERSTGVRAYRRIMYLWFFDPQRRTQLMGPLANPVAMKEFRSRRFGRAHWVMRLFGVCLILSLGLMYAASQGTIQRGPEVLGAILVVLQMALVILMTPSLAGGLISGELETGGWQMLQSTPLSAGSIIFGKLASVMWTLLMLLLATLPGYAVLIYIDDSRWQRISLALMTMLFTAIFALLVTTTVSSFFRRTATATTTAYTLLVGLVAGTLLFHLGLGSPFSLGMVEAVLAFNPLATALNLIEAPQFSQYELWPRNWYYMGAICLICFLLLLARIRNLTKPQ